MGFRFFVRVEVTPDNKAPIESMMTFRVELPLNESSLKDALTTAARTTFINLSKEIDS